MRALQYQRLGEPEDVLDLAEVDEPHPGAGEIRVRVAYCGLNPADWALCEGLFPGRDLPRGIGLEVSGTVDEVGAGVSDVAPGRLVLGPVPFDAASAGAADVAVLTQWTPVPDRLDPAHAAALPMAAETAWRCLDGAEVDAGQLVLVHGAGSVIGRMTAQLALHRGARVVATAGPRHADTLRAAGVRVTSYGEGMTARIRELAGGPVDRAIDAAPAAYSTVQASAADDVLADLAALTGDPERVLTASRFAEAAQLGARTNLTAPSRPGTLPTVAALAAEGVVDVPVAATYPLTAYPDAFRRSRSQQAGGKLLLALDEHGAGRRR